ncbi:hypothetical protein EJ03DRAFT_265021 [Teratosphaeria nubilosa]|uniref:Zn(2)-C6 fungal-type domain-containing protein n=1 Tax=Teratosphaeria nubilosa TaxID=161662 RepID=A0A6G1LK99_9PEZI|nr:hypothetical protein EJ03DRAFT_265021 [Teratosphaeria nubilosa]
MSWQAFDAPPAPTPTAAVLQASPIPQHISPAASAGGATSPAETHDGSRKRKRSSVVSPVGSSNGGLVHGVGQHHEHERNGSVSGSIDSPVTGKARHQPGVKRACNDCRQQKLRCNVVSGPGDYYKPCDRCVKHKLNCSIDNDFKRLGKRAAHEEMVKELDEARQKLAQFEALGMRLLGDTGPPFGSNGAPVANMAAPQAFLGPNEAAASRSLLDLSQGYREMPPTSYPSITPGTSPKSIRNVTLTEQQLSDLYEIYFSSFHPFLPVLNPEFRWDQYYALHPLLHWTIVAVAARRYDAKPSLLVELQHPLEEMIWTTLSQVPQIYHVCKALALLCTWPLPTSSTSQEPTMMLTGVMFQLAMQYGLHRPSHAQDFSRFRVDLRDEDIADRLNTWATINIVAQSLSTGQGQPPLSRWAWYTYGLHLNQMKPELHSRCQIEKFCDTVTRTLFTMQRDHIVEVDQSQRGLQIDMYWRELNEMEITLMSTRSSPIETLYLKAAALHLRLSAFFDKPTTPNYISGLRNVYIAASSLLTVILDLPQEIFHYVPRYIEQMILAAAVSLHKLLNSFYASHIDVPAARTLFSKSVNALRRLSVRSNDLPQRLAEVMAQLWQKSSSGEQKLFENDATNIKPDDSLQLHVRCRSSLSVLYDAIWRWRHQVGQEGRNNLERAVEHPTTISSESHTSRNTPQPPGLATTAPSAQALTGLGGLDHDALDMGWDQFNGNAVFDPLSWALDGNLQFHGGLGFGENTGLNFAV